MAEVDAMNKGYLAEIVDQRLSASLFLNFRPKIVSKRRIVSKKKFYVDFVKFISIAFLKNTWKRIEISLNLKHFTDLF